MRVRALSVAAAVMFLALACGELINGIPDDPNGGGGRCVCLPPVPDGWDGPIVVDEIGECAAPWDREQDRLYADLDAGTHACGCTCAAPTNTCTFKSSNEGNCTNPSCGNPFTLDDNCQVIGTTCSSHYRITVTNGGPCAPDAERRVDPPAFTRIGRRCVTSAPIQTGVCPRATDPCAPEHAATAAHCIAHDGELPCPPSWSTRRLYHAGISDTRDCTACTCADAGGACDVGFYDDQVCGNRIGTAPLGFCFPYGGGPTSLKVVRRQAACSAAGGQAVGSVAPTGPVTVCCRTE